MAFKVEVLVTGEREYKGNALRFDTFEAAAFYGDNLAGRWFAVDKWRVVEVKVN